MRWWQWKIRDEDLARELQSDLELEEEEQQEIGSVSYTHLDVYKRQSSNRLSARSRDGSLSDYGGGGASDDRGSLRAVSYTHLPVPAFSPAPPISFPKYRLSSPQSVPL